MDARCAREVSRTYLALTDDSVEDDQTSAWNAMFANIHKIYKKERACRFFKSLISSISSTCAKVTRLIFNGLSLWADLISFHTIYAKLMLFLKQRKHFGIHGRSSDNFQLPAEIIWFKQKILSKGNCPRVLLTQNIPCYDVCYSICCDMCHKS